MKIILYRYDTTCEFHKVLHKIIMCRFGYNLGTPSIRFITNRPIPQCNRQISHNGPRCNRNAHTCANFCNNMVHCGLWYWCTVFFFILFYSCTISGGIAGQGPITPTVSTHNWTRMEVTFSWNYITHDLTAINPCTSDENCAAQLSTKIHFNLNNVQAFFRQYCITRRHS